MLDDESTPTPDPTADAQLTDQEAAPEIDQEAAPETGPAATDAGDTPDQSATQKAPARKATAKKTAAKKTARKAPAKKAAAKKTAAKKAPAAEDEPEAGPSGESDPLVEVSGTLPDGPADTHPPATEADGGAGSGVSEQAPEAPGGAPAGAPAFTALFQPPDPAKATPRKRTAKKAAADDDGGAPDAEAAREEEPAADSARDDRSDADTDDSDEGEGGQRRRRRRGGRRRRKNGGDSDESASGESAAESPAESGDRDSTDSEGDGSSTSRRRRRRRRQGESDSGSADDPQNTVVRVREPRPRGDDEISGVTGSTRLEAKKQRRREGREAGRRRAPIVSEAEFLARREAVDRVMVVREREDVTQIGVLEDDVLVEHYVARESQSSLIGNVYLGRVQNVLPSMEAAFIDIGKGRNAVLYAGEVNWGVLGKDGQPRRIESALKSGQTILVQVTKDPVGHKGARLTSQISLPGRYLVYLPEGQTSGISRKLPDTERNRLKNLLKEILPEDAGVIIRTAAEGASEEELRRDVTRLTARWDDIAKKVEGGQAPQLLYGEPDLMIKVVRDLFTEDFKKLVVSGADAWDMIEGYVSHVAPDLMDRVERWTDSDDDVFAAYRIDEQIAKALERKVWLPSGGSLIIDRTEAMTVVDVNTGKFTGSGGNLEETVTKNNLEAAEEIVRQLRLRDIGGIIVIDFIDMVLESNRDLVLRRLIECLGRDRTRHQVAEVTSLGLVQMTRKRIGTGLLEAFSEPCESCGGRGLHTHLEPVEPRKSKDSDDSRRGGRRSRRGGDGGERGKKAEAKPDGKGKAEGKDKQDGGKDKADGKDKQADGKDKADGGRGGRRHKDAQKPAATSEPAATSTDEAVPAETVPADTAPAEPAEAGPAETVPTRAPEQAPAAAEAPEEPSAPPSEQEPAVATATAAPDEQPEPRAGRSRRSGPRRAVRHEAPAEPAAPPPTPEPTEPPPAAAASATEQPPAATVPATHAAATQASPAEAVAADGVGGDPGSAPLSDPWSGQGPAAPPRTRRPRRRAASRPAGPPQPSTAESG
jgi:ribonuclease E